jgi:putative hydrolase of the HAD superfamily
MGGVLFDLDGTLYDSKQYFFGAFRTISEYLSNKYGLSRANVYKKLVNIWKEKTSMYPRLFDDLLSSLEVNTREAQNLIQLFNKYEGELEPYPDAVPTLNALKKDGYKLGVITNGVPQRQKRKLELLGFHHFFDVVIFTKKIKPKPSPLPYLKALEELGIDSPSALYVGDNPLVDFEGAKKAGIKTVRILRGEFAKFPKNEYIDFEIVGLNEVLYLLRGKK